MTLPHSGEIHWFHFLHTICICGKTQTLKYLSIVQTSNGKQDATAEHCLHPITLAPKDPVSLRALSSEQRHMW